MKSIFNKEQQDYIVKNYLILSYKEIGSNLGFTERQIRGWLNNHGYNKNRKINDKYFDCIDTAVIYTIKYLTHGKGSCKDRTYVEDVAKKIYNSVATGVKYAGTVWEYNGEI